VSRAPEIRDINGQAFKAWPSCGVARIADLAGQFCIHRAARLSQYIASSIGFMSQKRIDRTTGSPPTIRGHVEGPLPPLRDQLFPLPIPPRPAHLRPPAGDRIVSNRRHRRWNLWFTARTVTETLVHIWNRWHLEDLGPAKARLARRVVSPSAYQLVAFDRLVASVHRSLRPCAQLKFGQGRGAQQLHIMIDQFLAKWPDMLPGSSFSAQGLATAEKINVETLRLPERAGQLDTAALLPSQAARKFLAGPARVLPTDSWPCPLPRACYTVSPEDEERLQRRLLATGMITLIPETQVARRPCGRLLLNGAFGVPHRKGQRAIFDCRPSNAGEERLRWGTLPCGVMLSWIRLLRGETVRGSGDDLSNWFYQLQESPSLVPRRAFGRSISSDRAAELGFPNVGPCRMALLTLAMGSLNSPDVAQEVHETVLRASGCLGAGLLQYGRPMPAGPLLEGVYLDDHLVACVVPRAQLYGSSGADRDLIEASHKGYTQHHIERSHDKAFGFSCPVEPGGTPQACAQFLAWGTHVDGLRGKVRAPVEKCAEIWGLTLACLTSRFVVKEVVSRLLGLMVHPILHARHLSAALGRVYTWHAQLAPATCVTWPQDVREELLAASLSLLVAETDIRRMVGVRVSTTDATPVSGGSTVAVVSPTLANKLFDQTEKRGEYHRLDWGPLGESFHPSEMSPPAEWALEAMECIPWGVSRSYNHEHSAHINIQEVREVGAEVEELSELNLLGERAANLVDSRVALGAWAKGRSSSKYLNRPLRASVGAQVVSNKSVQNLWGASERNPSDDPSRFHPLRAPGPLTPGLTEQLVSPIIPGAWEVVRELCVRRTSRRAPGRLCRPALDQDPWVRLGSSELLSYVLEETEVLGGRQWCREIFSGCGQLSKNLAALGGLCRAPMEAYPSKRQYIRLHDMSQSDVYVSLLRECWAGEYGYIHFGIPCSAWGSLARMNGSSRSLKLPDGARPFTKKDADSFELASRVVALCVLLHYRGSMFTVENPSDSMLWSSSPFCLLKQVVDTSEVVFDQCQFGLRPPGGSQIEYIRKRTRLLSNRGSVVRLARQCPGCGPEHQHVRALGTRKVETKEGPVSLSVAAWAGRYPVRLCDAWARVIEREIGFGARSGVRVPSGGPRA
jgi:hypothetical protein